METESIDRLAEVQRLERVISDARQMLREYAPEGASNGGMKLKPPGERELEFLRFHDIAPRLDQRWIVKGVMQAEQIAVVFGPPSCGKTFLALDIGLHIGAEMGSWCGRRLGTGWVIYVAAEAGRGIANRVSAWKQEHLCDDRRVRFAAITSPIDL